MANLNELKPEEVMKALEYCAKEDVVLCAKCPYAKTENDEYCANRLLKGALSLLREKDAEIERLRKHNTEMARKHYNDGKSDTVRKMQERLDKHFCHDPAFLGVEQRLIMDVIDQIAKEMVEVNE